MTKRVRWSVLLAAALAATSARAQTAQPAPAPPAQAPAPPPAQPPAQAPAANAGSQGQSSTAQPGSPGASSQQVVVNPPQPVPAAPPSSTTVVNPPPAAGTTVYAQPYGDPGVVEHRREKPNPVASVALDGAYGGVAGLLVGGGVALIERDHWGRDLMVGAGLGLIVGAAVGIVQAVYDSQRPEGSARAARPPPSRLVASDGLDRTDRDPVITARTVGLGFHF